MAARTHTTALFAAEVQSVLAGCFQSDPELQSLKKEAYGKTNQMRHEWRGSDWLFEVHGDRFRPIAAPKTLETAIC